MKCNLLSLVSLVSVGFSLVAHAAPKAGSYNVVSCFFEDVIETLRIDVTVNKQGKVTRFDTLGSDFRDTIQADILASSPRPDGVSLDFITSGIISSTTSDEIGASGWLRSVSIDRSSGAQNSKNAKVTVVYDFFDVHGGVGTQTATYDSCKVANLQLFKK